MKKFFSRVYDAVKKPVVMAAVAIAAFLGFGSGTAAAATTTDLTIPAIIDVTQATGALVTYAAPLLLGVLGVSIGFWLVYKAVMRLGRAG